MQDFPVQKKCIKYKTFCTTSFSNILQVTLEISAEKRVYLHVNNLLILSDLRPNRNITRTCSKILYYKTSFNTFNNS